MWRTFLQGDLGTSLVNNMSVAEFFRALSLATLELILHCLVWAVPTAILLGVIARYSRAACWTG